MHQRVSTALLLLAASTGAAAQPSIEFLPPGFILTDLSADGAAGAGNVIGDGSYETFRWTRTGGVVRLGRATLGPIGVAAGTPDISHDGTRVSASILSSDDALTWGVWDLDDGWTECMPPPPADGLLFDHGYGSAWGLSGDGQVVTGFYWADTGSGVDARASTWSLATGVVGLPQTPGRSARVNSANFDGSVVVGWEERADGVWRPTAWRDGEKVTLQDSLAFCEAGGVSSDGSVIVGSAYDEPAAIRSAAVWVWNGAAYDMVFLGALPLTAPNFGEAFLESVSDDGSIAVGFNRYFQSLGVIDGVVWTPDDGLVTAGDFLAGLGLDTQLPPSTTVVDMAAVSADGGTITGILRNDRTGEIQSFVVARGAAPCAGDTNGDHVVNFADLNAVLTGYGVAGSGLPGDVNGDGIVNFADLNEVLSHFGVACDS